MSKYDPEEYQKNKKAYKARNQRYKNKNRSLINSKQAEYRSKTKDKTNQYSHTRQKKIRVLYDEYMKNQSCLHCSYNDPRSLVWHHTNPSQKKNGVVQLVSKRHSWNTILAEINKCICLCHNCHNILHNHQSPPSP
jgi:hypothetical protein